MKLRYAVLLLVVPLAILPLMLSWLSPHSPLLQSRLENNGERYMLLALNLGAALERYHRDVTSVVGYVTSELRSGKGFEATVLLENLNVQHVCVFDSQTGQLLAQAAPAATLCPEQPPIERWELFKSLATDVGHAWSTVQPGPDGANLIFMVDEREGTLAAAAIDLSYMQDLGHQVVFGERGHAIIVDQAGNAMSHPVAQWQDEARSLGALPIVQQMLSGQSGVGQFYSPAINAEMIAGFTAVKGAGWGVVVPQPYDEIRAEARIFLNHALPVQILGACLAIVIAWFAAWCVAKPLERLSQAAGQVSTGQWPQLRMPNWMPLEFQTVAIAFNKMIDRLRGNVSHINQLAYFDTVSGLSNRAFFTRRAAQYLEDRSIRELGGCILFLDLNGFKAINDRFGHQAGDEILAAIGDRIADAYNLPLPIDLCAIEPLNAFLGHPPAVLAARLGGDEFALLLPCTSAQTAAEQSAVKLMEVFDADFTIAEETVRLGASIGIACYPEDGTRLADLLKKSDLAMYQAKKLGGDQVCVFADRRQTMTARSPRQV